MPLTFTVITHNYVHVHVRYYTSRLSNYSSVQRGHVHVFQSVYSVQRKTCYWFTSKLSA